MRSARSDPPGTRTDDVEEDLHGVRVADPYRWLEDGEAAEVRSWVDAQNAFTRSCLDRRPGRAALKRRLSRLLSIGALDPPRVRNGRYFFTRREGDGQNQPVLYVRSGSGAGDRVVVDPNHLNAEGTTAIDWWYPSEDGNLVVYGSSTGGDEKSTLRVIDVESGRHLPDTIPQTRYCSLAWLPDGSGFYYTRYPAPGEVPAGEENYNRRLFLHRFGDDPAADPEVFGSQCLPEHMIDAVLSRDGRYLVISVQEGWRRCDIHVRDLTAPGSEFMPVVQGIDALFEAEVIEGTLYLHTNWEAPRYRLIAIDLARPERHQWRTVIAEGDAVLSGVRHVGGRIIGHFLEDASSRVRIFDAGGRPVREIPLPALGTVDQITGRHEGHEVFLSFSSYTVAPTIYRHDLDSERTEVWGTVDAGVDLSGFEVSQVFYRSRDDRRISMFLVHRKGIELDGSHPAVLYGYGGFNINLTPKFSASRVAWLERGGIYAEANLRGGGEYGEAWHRDGMLQNKQNGFDDFHAAAEWLITQRYTRTDRLAIMGASNGGLLVGAALTQRPELYRAVICTVPLLDMLRYQNFRIARLWIPEFGSAVDPEQFRWLYGYSPYHRIQPNTPYPAVLLASAEGDSRVDPMHARKMAARLQASTCSERPVLLRMETGAGHGAGKPVSKLIDAATDIWSFLFWQLRLERDDASDQTLEGARLDQQVDAGSGAQA